MNISFLKIEKVGGGRVGGLVDVNREVKLL